MRVRKWTPIIEEGVDHVCSDCGEAYLQQLCYSADKRAEKAEEQLAASQAREAKLREIQKWAEVWLFN